jgi:hypothetical protein
MIPHANFTLAYDPIYTWAQGEQLVKEFVAQARKSTFLAFLREIWLLPTS